MSLNNNYNWSLLTLTSEIFIFRITDNVPKFLSYACLIMRMLYDVALDLYDKQSSANVVSFKSPAHRRYSEVSFWYLVNIIQS